MRILPRIGLAVSLALATPACKSETKSDRGKAKSVKNTPPSGETPAATPAEGPANPAAPGTPATPVAGPTPPGTEPAPGAAPAPSSGTLSTVELEAFNANVDTAATNLGDVEAEDSPPAVASTLQVEGASLTDDGLLPLLGNVHGRVLGYTLFNKIMLAFVVGAIEGAKPLLKAAAKGGHAAGSVDLSGDATAKLSRLDYEIVGTDAFNLVGFRGDKPFFALKVAGKTYAIVMNPALAPLLPERDGVSYALTLDFSSKSSWTLASQRIVATCDAASSGRPDATVGKIIRDGGVWRSRMASIYKRKLEVIDGGGCSDNPAEKVAYYTDFVGDAGGTTMALYIVPGDAAVEGDLTPYAASKVCTNFPAACAGLPLLSKALLGTIKNPICLGNGILPKYGVACAGGAAEVAKADFGAAAVDAPKAPSELEAVDAPAL